MAKTEFVIKPGTQEITMTRVFDAPRDLVFKAMMDPNAIPKWWGPRDHSTKVDKMELRPGGGWRFINGDSAGNEYGFCGFYHLIDAPKRVVETYEFEGTPGHVGLVSMTLEEVDGKTRLVEQSLFPSVEDRDAVVKSGMEKGATESMDRLAELLAELTKDKLAR
ncbi:MAG TPA: SRPBCC family protein [Candidatus Dormibacteraeota bacterium]|nr:SRPBCC family protein [Candidatus Dormibacteraeota bacterium]